MLCGSDGILLYVYFFQIKDTLHWIHILFQQLRAGTLALEINALKYIKFAHLRVL